MLIFKISQDVNNGYDTYSSAVVIAATEDAARRMHPRGRYDDEDPAGDLYEWAAPKDVKVELIGVATGDAKPRVVTASYHAG